MVDLEPLDDDDTTWLSATDLPAPRRDRLGGRAAGILDRLADSVRSFKKVMPRDYKRVLEAIQAAPRRSGIDVDEAIMAAARG